MLKLYNSSIKAVAKRFLSINSEKVKNGNTIRTALLQLNVGPNHFENIKHAEYSIKKAKENGAQLVILPECPYSNKQHVAFSEDIYDGYSAKTLSKAAKDNSVYLVGGTLPEKEGSTLYNTCVVWNPNGEMIAMFRKLHLFDVQIPGGITFTESDVLTGGSKTATFMMDGVKIGLGICHDLRFEELAKLYRLQECKILIYPSAFSMTTGPTHFELLQRARAADNQVFVITVSPARAQKGYIAWGHSQVTNPWGKVLLQAGYKEETLYCDLDLSICDEVRQQIPVINQRRSDIYDTISKE